uniref:Coiled-coil domain containing 170 n=1 Tax=Cyanoderma ruficeps TaxID=181631 RepID=A0A8C3QX48_9PASS
MTQASKISKTYEELLTDLSGCLDIDIRGKEKPQEHLTSKASEICKENVTLKDQVAALQEAVNVHEMESKANRETIMRLVSEVAKEQKKAAGYYQDMEKLRKDLDSAIIKRQSLEMEIRNLQEKLTVNQKALDTSKQELHNLKKSSRELDASLKSSTEEARTAQSSLEAFKEEIATLLSCGSAIVKPSEKSILERIQEINCKEKNKEIMISQLETKLAKLTKALENQTRLYHEALERSRKAEKCSENFHDQLKHLQEELLTGDLMQDGLKLEKQKYLKFLEQLNEKMKLDSLAAEVGFDMAMDVILARVEQLVKLEGEAVVENKTAAYNLRRQLKAQKEKLESKELHMNLLRQKITQLEEEKQVRAALAVERDEANLAVRKLHKMIERLQKQLDLARETNTDLKAKLSETSELKLADFREVVARMLGLDIASLALPDYEIIARLDGLIHSHQHNFFPCVCLKDVARTPEEQQGNIQLLH